MVTDSRPKHPHTIEHSNHTHTHEKKEKKTPDKHNAYFYINTHGEKNVPHVIKLLRLNAAEVCCAFPPCLRKSNSSHLRTHPPSSLEPPHRTRRGR